MVICDEPVDRTEGWNIAIYGAGDSGRKAFRILSAGGCFNIRYFFDSDVKKAGTTINSVPVVVPEREFLSQVDFVHIASMYEREIRESFQERFPEFATKIRDLVPGVFLITLHKVNRTHGLGVLAERLFSDFPPSKIVNFSVWNGGANIFHNTYAFPPKLPRSVKQQKIREVIKTLDFSNPLIFSAAIEEEDAQIAEIVIDEVTSPSYVHQHFFDLRPTETNPFHSGIARLIARTNDVTAFTPSLAKEISEIYECKCEHLATIFQRNAGIDVPAISKRSLPRVVVIGNLWMNTGIGNKNWLHILDSHWGNIRALEPELSPISWFASPMRVQQLLGDHSILGENVAWKGFLPDVQAHLRQFDLALVPFCNSDKCDTNYSKYSFPSRLSEYCAAGLPVMAISSSDSTVAEFIRQYEFGRSFTYQEFAEEPHLVLDFLKSVQVREMCAQNSLHVFQNEFNEDLMRPVFLQRILEGNIHP